MGVVAIMVGIFVAGRHRGKPTGSAPAPETSGTMGAPATGPPPPLSPSGAPTPPAETAAPPKLD
jgi:hypothetical protein